MDPDIQEIIESIDGIASTRNPEDALEVDAIVEPLFNTPHPEQGTDALLRVFERFPAVDSHATWSILHAIEALPNYDPRLIESVRRQPALPSVLMIHRLMNGGTRVIGGVDLLQLLQDTAANPDCPEVVRRNAHDFATLHHKRSSQGGMRRSDKDNTA